MSDLIELRKHYCDDASCEVMRNEAADEIERLRNTDTYHMQEEIEQLQGTNKILGQWVEDKDKHIAKLQAIVDLAFAYRNASFSDQEDIGLELDAALEENDE